VAAATFGGLPSLAANPILRLLRAVSDSPHRGVSIMGRPITSDGASFQVFRVGSSRAMRSWLPAFPNPDTSPVFPFSVLLFFGFSSDSSPIFHFRFVLFLFFCLLSFI
jgi:hypothetical protein